MKKTLQLLVLALGLLAPILAAAQSSGWLGVGLAALEGEEATERGLSQPAVVVNRVFPLSPASEAGLVVGDVLLSFQGQALEEPTTLVTAVGTTPANTEVELVVLRGGETLTQRVTLQPRPNFEELAVRYLTGSPARPIAARYAQGAEGQVDLSALSGSVVLIDFWATTCGPCLMSIPRLNELQARYAAQGLRVIGISNEDEALVADAIDTFGIQYPIAIDQGEQTGQEYLITAYPTMVVIDRAGTVREVHIGANDLDALDQRIASLLAAP